MRWMRACCWPAPDIIISDENFTLPLSSNDSKYALMKFEVVLSSFLIWFVRATMQRTDEPKKKRRNEWPNYIDGIVRIKTTSRPNEFTWFHSIFFFSWKNKNFVSPRFNASRSYFFLLWNIYSCPMFWATETEIESELVFASSKTKLDVSTSTSSSSSSSSCLSCSRAASSIYGI